MPWAERHLKHPRCVAPTYARKLGIFAQCKLPASVGSVFCGHHRVGGHSHATVVYLLHLLGPDWNARSIRAVADKRVPAWLDTTQKPTPAPNAKPGKKVTKEREDIVHRPTRQKAQRRRSNNANPEAGMKARAKYEAGVAARKKHAESTRVAAASPPPVPKEEQVEQREVPLRERLAGMKSRFKHGG